MNPASAPGHERLSGAWNFRDVAETAGLRPGRLFRSGELSHLDDAGRSTLAGLGVTDVADLRSPVEVQRRGAGAVPDGVAVHNLPFPEVSHHHDGEAPHESSWQKMMTEYSEQDPSLAAQRWMTQEYERFPTLGGARRAVRQLITMIGDGRRVLVHCFAGKDRTGFAVAVALVLAPPPVPAPPAPPEPEAEEAEAPEAEELAPPSPPVPVVTGKSWNEVQPTVAQNVRRKGME